MLTSVFHEQSKLESVFKCVNIYLTWRLGHISPRHKPAYEDYTTWRIHGECVIDIQSYIWNMVSKLVAAVMWHMWLLSRTLSPTRIKMCIYASMSSPMLFYNQFLLIHGDWVVHIVYTFFSRGYPTHTPNSSAVFSRLVVLSDPNNLKISTTLGPTYTSIWALEASGKLPWELTFDPVSACLSEFITSRLPTLNSVLIIPTASWVAFSSCKGTPLSDLRACWIIRAVATSACLSLNLGDNLA